MFFNIVQFILAFTFGLIGMNHASNKVPTVYHRNCTHVTYHYHYEHPKDILYQDNGIIIFQSRTQRTPVAEVYFGNDEFLIELLPEYLLSDHIGISIRASPIPFEREQNYSVFFTFHYVNEIDRYRLSLEGFLLEPKFRKVSAFDVQKSRCFPQDDIIGCDPYCLCDTPVQKKCQDGSLISGKCLDPGRVINDNTANYIFNEECESYTKIINENRCLKTIIGLVFGGIIVVLALAAFFYYRRKKKDKSNYFQRKEKGIQELNSPPNASEINLKSIKE